jgi:hypothetical protein
VTSPESARKNSVLTPGSGAIPLARFFAVEPASNISVASVVASLNAQGYWLAPLGTNSHPYRGDGSPTAVPGDFSQTHVGDETDTSPYPDDKITGISIASYIRNMSALMRSFESSR